MKNIIYIFIIVTSLISCKSTLQNKNYYNLSDGSLSFINSDNCSYQIIDNNDNCKKGDTCFLYKVEGTFDSLRKDKNLNILLKLNAKYHSRKWSGAVSNGSIEKIKEFKFIFIKDTSIFVINSYNINSQNKVYCSEYLDKKGMFLISSDDNKWHSIKNKTIFPHHQIPILNVMDFIDHYNNNSLAFDQIERFQFHFYFDKLLFNNLTFNPKELVLEIKLQNPLNGRVRVLKINRKLNQSDIYYYD